MVEEDGREPLKVEGGDYNVQGNKVQHRTPSDLTGVDLKDCLIRPGDNEKEREETMNPEPGN